MNKMPTQKHKGNTFIGVIVFLLIAMTVWYSLVGIFERQHDPVGAFEVFILESGFAATSGFVAPINAHFRNEEGGSVSEYGYQRDLSTYADVYKVGLNHHPIALVLGDIFGSIFSILSAIAFVFAIRSSKSMGAFKVMFWTEIIEESLYYINVDRMTGDVDLTIIDIGVSLVIAFIVAGIAESARKHKK